MTGVGRRQYLTVVGTLGLGTLAGCLRVGVSEATQEQYISVATQAATQLTDWRDNRSQTLLQLSETDELRNETQAQQRLRESASELAADVVRVSVVASGDRTVLASSDPAKTGAQLNTREAPWEIESLTYGEDGVFISEAVEALGASLISFVTPVTDDRILVLQSNLDTVAGTLPVASDGGYSQVVNASGNIVAGTRDISELSRNDGVLQRYPAGADAPAVSQGLDGESGFIAEPEINGTEEVDGSYSVAFAAVEGAPWVIVTHIPRSGY